MNRPGEAKFFFYPLARPPLSPMTPCLLFSFTGRFDYLYRVQYKEPERSGWPKETRCQARSVSFLFFERTYLFRWFRWFFFDGLLVFCSYIQ